LRQQPADTDRIGRGQPVPGAQRAIGEGDYSPRLRSDHDDAVGEAFDKTAKMLGLGFPGGPAVQAAAEAGDPKRFAFPRPMKGRPGCDFSFSGLKTAVRHAIVDLPDGPASATDSADIAASFQTAVTDVVADRCGIASALDCDERVNERVVIAGLRHRDGGD